MACVTRRTSIIVYVVFHLISSLVIYTRANVLSGCAYATTCIGTYADIYNSLASEGNSFNIESALYPANEPSSVLVFVNIYSQNEPGKTSNDSVPGVIKYTWSVRSLYAAFPAVFLEISSLFSILVTPRTQELNITIPNFCCNVSVKDRKRIIKDVLAALQDLAVIPSLRDPRLNFAESVIEGHTPDMKTTGCSYLRVVLWFSFLCPMFLGPFLYFWILQYLKDNSQGTSPSAGSDGNRSREDHTCCKGEEPLTLSVTIFCCFLLVIEIIFVLVTVLISTEISHINMPQDVVVLVLLIPEWLMICCCNCLCCEDLNISSVFSRLLLIMCTSLVSYHLSWIAVGIMINPDWGISLLLVLSLFFIALFFVINKTTCADYHCSTFSTYTPGFFGLCFLVIPPVLVGQTYYGRETADDIVKTSLISVIVALSVLFFKSWNVSSNASSSIGHLREQQL